MLELLLVISCFQAMVSCITLVVLLLQMHYVKSKVKNKVIAVKKQVGKNAENTAEDFDEKVDVQKLMRCLVCRSDRLSGVGSNQYIAVKTCSDCKSVFRTEKQHYT